MERAKAKETEKKKAKKKKKRREAFYAQFSKNSFS